MFDFFYLSYGGILMDNYNKIHNVYVVENCGNDFSRLGTIEASNLNLEKISGTVNSTNSLKEYSQYDASPEVVFKDTLLWTGSWLGFFYDQESEKGLFSTDYFGFGSIFYTVIRNALCSTLIVGDSFRGVVKKRKEFINKLDISWEVALPHLITNTNLFSTRCSSRTFAKDINILHHDEIIIFDKFGISVINKSSFINTAEHDYNYWLDKGIERAISIINSAGETNAVNEISLSGGKDSRALLGLILKSNNKKITAYTAAPLGVAPGESREILEKDFKLSCMLTEKYNVPWNLNNQFSEYRVSFDEALESWQNLRGNLSFDLRPKYSQVVNKNEIRFTGIGGELFRSYIGIGYIHGFPAWWNSCGKTKASIRLDLTSLFKVLCSPAFIEPEIYKAALTNFVDSLDFGYGSDVISQLDINYIQYRSRCHSAVHSTHSREGALLAYPLCLPEFVIASRKLPREEQEGGRTLFDIIEKTCPNLNTLDYASPPWPSNYLTKGHINSWYNISGQGQSVLYKEMVSARTKSIDHRGLAQHDFKQSALCRLEENMNKLRIHAEFEGLTFFEGVTQRVARAYQKNDQSLYALVSKTQTLLDIIEPLNINVACCTLSFNTATAPYVNQSVSPPLKQYGLEANQTQKKILSKFSDICESIDMSSIKFEANINEINKKVVVNIVNRPENCQVACYLYINGHKVDQVWYDLNDILIFNLNEFDESFQYRVTVFFKWKGEVHAQRVESLTLTCS